MLVFHQIQVGLEFLLRVSMILGYHYRASTWLRLQSLGIRLDNEPRYGTLLRRNLVLIDSKETCHSRIFPLQTLLTRR